MSQKSRGEGGGGGGTMITFLEYRLKSVHHNQISNLENVNLEVFEIYLRKTIFH